jgi:hypothetical protein
MVETVNEEQYRQNRTGKESRKNDHVFTRTCQAKPGPTFAAKQRGRTDINAGIQ